MIVKSLCMHDEVLLGRVRISLKEQSDSPDIPTARAVHWVLLTTVAVLAFSPSLSHILHAEEAAGGGGSDQGTEKEVLVRSGRSGLGIRGDLRGLGRGSIRSTQVSASAAVVAAAALQAAVLISGRLSSASSGKKEVTPEQLIEATS
ncbi:hypothetical protein OPV22_003508 [Ensete ventricosum]|uniref:VAN3-binding protein-like auxin canalisation domain-containing protein n=1 Tax=Ensete ventricosum TaxID=4639 RepID=A0AAV8S154_ENSVE|nr:hypothetical protein OPV22_003508 [Ensete ventricosum]